MAYTTILFDVGDTLLQVPRPATVYQRLLETHGKPFSLADVEAMLAVTRRTMDEQVPRWLGDDLTLDAAATARRRELHVDGLLALAGLSAHPAVRQAFFDLYVGTEFFTIFPDVRETLPRLRAEGYRLGIVSNWEARLLQLCAAHGIAEYFDFAVVSELEGYSKPHPQLYRRALELAGAAPDQVLHVGDKLREDVEGATSVGIRAVLLDRAGANGVDYQPRIGSLLELFDVLAAAQTSPSRA